MFMEEQYNYSSFDYEKLCYVIDIKIGKCYNLQRNICKK